jgi:LysR family carnitine catabolism transcriptional activator
MNVSIKQLRGFIAIAETGSFAEASERLYISQPALSIAIGKLEDTVGGLLFNRSTRSVQLTPEGLEFLPIAQRLIADWSEAFDDLNRLFSLKRGKLTVAAMPSFARLLTRFRRVELIWVSLLSRITCRGSSLSRYSPTALWQ